MLTQAMESLSIFLEYITYGHMIDNVVLIVMGTFHERDVHELLEKCHPLGLFDSIATLAVAQNMQELYRVVLVDTSRSLFFRVHHFRSTRSNGEVPSIPVHIREVVIWGESNAGQGIL